MMAVSDGLKQLFANELSTHCTTLEETGIGLLCLDPLAEERSALARSSVRSAGTPPRSRDCGAAPGSLRRVNRCERSCVACL